MTTDAINQLEAHDSPDQQESGPMRRSEMDTLAPILCVMSVKIN